MQRFGDDEGFFVLNTPNSVMEAVATMEGLAEVEYAEPNYIYTHDAAATDPYFTNGTLWGMNGTYGSQAATAWGNNHTGSSSVAVGVIDEGIYYAHPDLIGNIWTNPGEIAGNGFDDDQNGYIDDIHGMIS